MRIILRTSLSVVSAAALLLGGATPMQAAGALAIGACAAYGYAYDYPTAEAAQAAAIEKCSGDCKQVVTTKKGCVAYAIDGRKPCGPNGFANAPRRGTEHCAEVLLRARRQGLRYPGLDLRLQGLSVFHDHCCDALPPHAGLSPGYIRISSPSLP